MIRFITLFMLFSTLSCIRRPLEEGFIQSALIPVKFDWTYSYLNPDIDQENLYNASVWLYAHSGTPFSGKSYMEYSLATSKGGEIEVPVGVYRVLAFNNSIRSFSSNCGFRGVDNYETFEYFVHPATRVDGSKSVSEPDLLAVWRSDYFEVTADMISISRNIDTEIAEESRSKAEIGLNQLLNIAPTRLTCNVSVSVYAAKINHSKSATGLLRGMAQSVKLWSEERFNYSSYLFPFEKRDIRRSDIFFGNVSANFRSMGPVQEDDSRSSLDVRFELTAEDDDGNTHYPALGILPFSFDVTDQVESSTPTTLWTVVIEIGDDEDDPDITLPNVNPGGFSPGVGDWGTEEDIEIPVNH